MVRKKSKISKKAQISFEYISIVSFGLAILLSGIYIFYSYSMSSNDAMVISRVEEAGYNIIHHVETLYYTTGVGSSVFIEINLPESIKDSTFSFTQGETELVFEYTTSGGTTEAIFFTPINMTSNNPQGTGYTFFNAGDVHSGSVMLKITKINGGIRVDEKT